MWKAILDWQVWKVNGQFNMELLRAFSSMYNGKGLPKQADVEAILGWQVWKVNGQFSIERFRAFSSMLHSKGLPKQADVESDAGAGRSGQSEWAVKV